MTDDLAVLERLIRFDTVSAKPNAEIIDYISDFLRQRGAKLTPIAGPEEGKLGLVATLGPMVEGGIVLSAHTDVVPVTGQTWTKPPFIMTRSGDRVFGRGTTDMKGFVAEMLLAAEMAAEAELTAPLHLVFSYDEEIGCVGIQTMKPHLQPLLPKPRLCIVGEPTQMQVAIGHKGKVSVRAQCRGEAGHSALAPKFTNALHLATDLVNTLRATQADLEQNGARDRAYDIPYSTVHVGRLHGGQALNIVPEHAELDFEIRYLGRDDAVAILAGIQAASQSASVTFDTLNAYPGLDVPEDAPVVATVLELAQQSRTTKVAFGTEAGVFAEIGIPTIVCGPGSMEGQGHKADEYIALSELDACRLMMQRVVAALST